MSLQRISFNIGLKLFEKATLQELQELAMEQRYRHNPEKRVTFVLDSNPNYTNVCNADCSFCAFYRKENASDAYTKTVDQVMQHLELARKAGCSTVLLQGGLHPHLKLDYYVELVKTARKRYPEIAPHFFSAPEIYNIAKVSNCSIKDVFTALYEAGQRSFPGGGAEILSEPVRQRISPKKMEKDAWINIHKTAHEVGFKSTATMMYGHVETPHDVLTHFEALRNLQDETGGFTAFIPWSYKRDRTALRREVKTWAGPESYLRMIAFARLYLDNFPHVQGSWFSEGKEVGIASLNSGADDFGGIILEENVHRATHFIHHSNVSEVVAMIREAGFEAAERDPLYNILKSYEGIENIETPEAQKVFEADQLSILEGKKAPATKVPTSPTLSEKSSDKPHSPLNLIEV